MAEHSAFDALINRFLDARRLLEQAQSELAPIVDSPDRCGDSAAIRQLYREIDEYLRDAGTTAADKG
jgi:hypothetical protein